jgi:hypothetical protein
MGAAIVIWGSIKQDMNQMVMLYKDNFAILGQCMAVRRLYLWEISD